MVRVRSVVRRAVSPGRCSCVRKLGFMHVRMRVGAVPIVVLVTVRMDPVFVDVFMGMVLPPQHRHRQGHEEQGWVDGDCGGLAEDKQGKGGAHKRSCTEHRAGAGRADDAQRADLLVR